MLEISRSDISSTEIVDYGTESFLKLPISKYIDLLPPEKGNKIVPIPPQIALINAVNNPTYRFIVAALSRRTGKSFISNIIGQLTVLVPGNEVLIIAPNYSLSAISWDLQRKFLKTFDIELERANAKDKVLELKNYSTIRMASVSQADSAVGRSYKLIIFDEAALGDAGKDAFNIQLRPTLDRPDAKAIFISTPRGKNWFYDFYQRGFDDDFPNWCSIRSDWSENPRATEADILEAKKSMSREEFLQEYHADFVAMQGQIFKINPLLIQDIDTSSVERVDIIAGLDMGFRDATSFVVMITDGRNFYIVDEYEQAGKTTKQHADTILAMIEKWDIDFVYIDSAAAQTAFDFAMEFGISTIKAKKSILDGIGYVQSIVDNDRLIVDNNCYHVRAALDNYRWDDREGLNKERPKHDEYSHMADALRYALYSHSQNMDGLMDA